MRTRTLCRNKALRHFAGDVEARGQHFGFMKEEGNFLGKISNILSPISRRGFADDRKYLIYTAFNFIRAPLNVGKRPHGRIIPQLSYSYPD